jgi:TldD protein
MTENLILANPFFENSDLTPEKTIRIVQDGLHGTDYGEFYQDIVGAEMLVKDKGLYTVVSPSNIISGFGFRAGQDARVGYSYSEMFNQTALQNAIGEARQVLRGNSPARSGSSPGNIPQHIHGAKDPKAGMSFSEKINAIDEIENYARSLDSGITNVTLSYSSTSKAVHIITADGRSLVDYRPVTNLLIGLMVTDQEGKSEQGQQLIGGAVDCMDVFNEAAYKKAVEQALHQAKELLIAKDAPAGVMDVVMARGWGAVILHEAIGHGMEADFNRRNISVYSGKIGERISSPEVSIIDQGDIPGERGSLQFDDEGVPTQPNILVENGILRSYMQDCQNSGLMKTAATGNGRRQSYKHVPMPRMTNTYFANGTHDPQEIIRSVKDGLYVAHLGGGSVDITSGKFNMNVKLAYRIRDGQICEPIKGATLVGDGMTVLKNITMVGNDLEIEKAAGVCSKNGQNLIVGCGQPTILVSQGMTIGGMG